MVLVSYREKMGRTILAEDKLKEPVDALFGQCKLQIGLIIGQVNKSLL